MNLWAHSDEGFAIYIMSGTKNPPPRPKINPGKPHQTNEGGLVRPKE